ncbi:hypothetical protein BH23GEM9_BH23GEM9_34090 [soil metagenome]
MPADSPNIGMGRRRQGYTGPDRDDDSKRSMDRAIDEERLAGESESFERGKVPGATGADTPHRPVKPGTRSDLEDAGLGGDPD